MLEIAQIGLLLILSLLTLFHIAILLKQIPYHIVWAGRLKSDKEMYRFESISLLVNLLFLFFVAVDIRLLLIELPPLLLSILFYFMAAFFFLNTLGNLTSKSSFEKFAFTPLTLVMSFFSLILAIY